MTALNIHRAQHPSRTPRHGGKKNNERPGADVDEGFETTESELAEKSGEAAERETLAGNGFVMCACAVHSQGCGACG